jgi:hypothetical protein
MFKADSDYQVKQHTSQYFASQLITQEWVQPGDAVHQIFSASSDVTDSAGHVLVTAYAVLRPDGQWSLLLVNKDRNNAHSVRIVFHDSNANGDRFFARPVGMMSFGSAQYEWHAKGKDGYANPDGPAVTSTVSGRADTLYTLPKASVTVLRGKVEGLPATTLKGN